MSEPAPTFADWLFNTGRALGYTTNSALARALGVPQPTVSRWKTGSKPSVEHLVKISELFGVELKLLLVLAGYMKGDVRDIPLEAPTSKAERLIAESEVGEAAEALLSSFWGRRQDEELKRLEKLVAGIQESVRLTGSYDLRSMEKSLDDALQTELPQHVHHLVRGLTRRKLAYQARWVLYSKELPKDGEPDAFAESEEAHASLTARVYETPNGWGFEVVPGNGAWALVGSPFDSRTAAEESLALWAMDHPNFDLKLKEDEDAPEA
ncbi:helix-turn-helix domain-containing protein [Nocardiopsis sp. CA-288880]|uniref:helix-turn-helix domain-containing protein n=1 Tax=Nocardiopsis sp. CA-288880 TaxID=3239995 RepID=UPI003D954561